MANMHASRSDRPFAREPLPQRFCNLERLLQVDPLTAVNVCMRGMVVMFDGRYDEALRWTQRSVDVDPENPTSRMVHALMLAANRREDEAVALLQPVALDTPGMAWAELASALAGALRGDRDEVLRVMTPQLRQAIILAEVVVDVELTLLVPCSQVQIRQHDSQLHGSGL